MVDLDTSHPAAWLAVERALGHEVTGVWDASVVHPADYAEKFAAERGIPTVYSSLEQMAADVDAAIIHGCDWATHVQRARPFVAAGKAVLIDKPLAGNLADLHQIEAWVTEGARICGGSALRFATETTAWLAQPVAERGSPQTVLCGCGTDEFNFGIHAYALLLGIMGSGVQTVRSLEGDGQWRVQLHWADGGTGVLVLGPSGVWLPFQATVVTDRTVTQYQPEPGLLYQALPEAALPYLAGQAPAPLPIETLTEAERCAVAACQSRAQSGQTVSLADLSRDIAYDGWSSAVTYRRQRNPDDHQEC